MDNLGTQENPIWIDSDYFDTPSLTWLAGFFVLCFILSLTWPVVFPVWGVLRLRRAIRDHR